MKLERAIRAGRLEVEIDDHLAAVADNVLDALVECDDRGPHITADSRIAFAWVALAFAEISPGVLEIREPRMTEVDPGKTQSGISDTVRVLAGQAAVCRMAGAEGEPAWFTAELIVDNEALTSGLVFLRRNSSVAERDSGFYLGCSDRAGMPDKSGLSRLAVWQLFSRRPALVTAMALPVGYTALFTDEQLTAILDGDGRAVFQRPPDVVS